MYLCQHVRVQPSGSMGVTEAMLPAARASDGRILCPSQRIMSTYCHGHSGGGAASALRAVKGWGQALTPSKEELSGTEVTRHWRRAPFHHPPIPIVIRAAEGAAE